MTKYWFVIRFSLISVFTLLFLSVSAQTYRPFLEEGKKWVYYPDFDSYGYPYELRIDGDTIVDGQKCKKLYRQDDSRNQLYAFLYEDGPRVFYRLNINGLEDWGLLFDFSLNPGDVATDPDGYEYVVDAVDTIMYKGAQFRRVIFECTIIKQAIWIEGVGGRGDMFDPFWNLAGDYCRLVSCKKNGEEYFDPDLFIQDINSIDRQSGMVKINGLKYRLNEEEQTAMVDAENRWMEAERVMIPSEVVYKGEKYAVTSMRKNAFSGNNTLKSVSIPATIKAIVNNYYSDVCNNPFVACNSLDTIEVDIDNPWICSDNGILYSKDRTELYSYPAGRKELRFIVPDDVQHISKDAFSRSPYLTYIELPFGMTEIENYSFLECTALEQVSFPSTITSIGYEAFCGCTSLKSLELPASVTKLSARAFEGCSPEFLIIKGVFTPENLNENAFYGMSTSTILYVCPSEVEKFQHIYSGRVLPLSEQVSVDTSHSGQNLNKQGDSTFSHTFFNLQGIPLMRPSARVIYIFHGKKYVQ